MTRVLAALAVLALAGSASAQLWAFGAQYRLGGDATASVTLEWPAFEAFGLRAGPSVNVRGHLGPEGYGAVALAGLTVAFVPSTPTVAAIMLEVNYEAVWRSGQSARYGPSVGLFLTGRW